MFNRPTKANKVKRQGAKFRTLSTDPDEIRKADTPTKESEIFNARLADIDKIGNRIDDLLKIKAPTILDKAEVIKLTLSLLLQISRLGEIDENERKLAEMNRRAEQTNNLTRLNTLLEIAEKEIKR